MDIQVTIGDITTAGLSNARFDVITLGNNIGTLKAQQLWANRINLNTSTGVIDASSLKSHFAFLLARDDGGYVNADNVELVVCDQEEGKLTVDVRGGEGERVSLKYIAGGSIQSKVRVGNTNLMLRACSGFAGNYTLRAPHGSKQVEEYRPGLDLKSAAASYQPNQQSDLYTITQQSRTLLSGSICPQQQNSPKQLNLTVESITTGDILIQLIP
eukprot:jgi/Chlat1/3048/Chrsp208S03300